MNYNASYKLLILKEKSCISVQYLKVSKKVDTCGVQTSTTCGEHA